MLEKLVLAALGKDAIERLVRQELERLEQGGFLKRAELERLSAECLGALASRAAEAKGTIAPIVSPLVGAVASQVREAMDLPSRAEVLALTEALSRAERPSAPAPSPEAGVAAR